MQVIKHYSKGENCCELCGITDTDVLSIDYFSGSEQRHRKEFRGGYIVDFLIKNNIPQGFPLISTVADGSHARH